MNDPRNLSQPEHVTFLKPVSVSDFAVRLGGGATVRPGTKPLSQLLGISDGRVPAASTLCFMDKAPDPSAVDSLRKALVVTNAELAPALEACSILVVPDPRAFFIDLLERLNEDPGFSYFTTIVTTLPNVDSSAQIDPTAVIETGVSIGPRVRIAAGCVIKRGTAIGGNVVIRENTVIGGHGIALYRAQDGRLLRFPDLGGVVIEERVEIGASCTIPGGVLTSTFVGKDSVIGNLCNVGHGVKIGPGVWISVGAMIGGNSSIGARSTLGLGVSIRDNIQIGNDCSIGMGSVVVRPLADGTSVFGNPARRLPGLSAGPDR